MKHFNIHKRQKRTRSAGKIFGMALALMALSCFRPAQAQEVRIHQLGLGDGDCTVMMLIDSVTDIIHGNRLDTVAILIDAQRNSANAATEISRFIDSNIGKYRKTIDYVILSHLHIDHYGNMVDVLKDLKTKGYTISAILDRNAYQFPRLAWSLDKIDSCYSNILAPSKTSAAARTYDRYIIGNYKTKRRAVDPGKDLLYGRGFMNLKLTCLAANGATLDTNGRITPFIPNKFIRKNGKRIKTDSYLPKSENDLSLAFLLSFQGFTYFTGGDLGGPSHGGNYSDGEGPIAEYLDAKNDPGFHFCSFKVSHHGSAESSDASFLSLVKPTLAVVPASLRTYGSSKNPLPTCATLTNLRNHTQRIEYTFVPKNTATWQQYCKYQNLQNTKDVAIKVTKLPGYDTIKIYIATQNRDGNFALAGPVTLDSIDCTKTHPVIKLATRENNTGIHMASQPHRNLPGAAAEVPADTEKPRQITARAAAALPDAPQQTIIKTDYEKSPLRR
jgi:beta-lactamase superfamily II metal-dependent hydrolase